MVMDDVTKKCALILIVFQLRFQDSILVSYSCVEKLTTYIIKFC